MVGERTSDELLEMLVLGYVCVLVCIDVAVVGTPDRSHTLAEDVQQDLRPEPKFISVVAQRVDIITIIP